MLRTDGRNSASYADLFPPLELGSLLKGTAPAPMQKVWARGSELLATKPGRLKALRATT